MNLKQSLTDTAFLYMSDRKRALTFEKLWEKIAKELDIPEERNKWYKKRFYSELMEDGRFVALKNKKWDLKKRHSICEIINKYEDDMDIDDEEIEIDTEEDDDDSDLHLVED